jgi:hypothetical protein
MRRPARVTDSFVRIGIAAGTVAAALLWLPAVRSQAQTAPRATALIVGQVIDAVSREPVAESIVTLGGGGTSTAPLSAAARGARIAGGWQVMTDASGRFFFRGLGAGSYTIGAAKYGYVSGQYGRLVPRGAGATLELADGDRIGDIQIALWKHGAIAGSVVDEAGEPVAAAIVHVLRQSTTYGRPYWSASNYVVTDDRGMYRTGSLEPGRYLVGVLTVATTQPAALLEEYFRPSAPAASRTTLQSLLPSPYPPGHASNQRVGDWILQVSGPMVTPPPVAADGTMTIYPTTFSPQAMTPRDAETIVLAAGAERTGVDVRLRPVRAARVSGVLTASDGAPGQTALRLTPAGPAGNDEVAGRMLAAATTISQADGRFTFLGVAPGQYTLRAQTPSPDGGGALWAREAVTVGANDVDIRVSMQRPVSISGMAVFEGATETRPDLTRSGIRIDVQPMDRWDNVSAQAALIDAQGRFTLSGLLPGRSLLTIRSAPSAWMVKSIRAGERDLSDAPFELTADLSNVVVTFSDRLATMAGRVTDSRGAADPFAVVIAMPADPALWVDFGSYPRRLREGRPKRDGSFSFSGLPAGDYLVAAVPQDVLDWTNPELLPVISRIATRTSVDEGGLATVNLTVRRPGGRD